MSAVTTIMLIFSMLGAIDRILGNRFGLGREFEKGFMLLGTMALSMIGMIVVSPLIAGLLSPCFDWVYEVLKIDPSVLPAILFANDMGGAALAGEIAKHEGVGMFNALVISAMMGVTISFTIPYALGIVKKERHRELFFCLLCGIVTIPVGAFLSGLMLKIPLTLLVVDLLPLILISAIIACGLIFVPDLTVKLFSLIGVFMRVLITAGLALGIFEFLTGMEVVKGLASIREGADVCLNAAIVLSGAFPLMHVVSKILAAPMEKLGAALKINPVSAMGLLSTVVTNATTLEMVNRMDRKGAFLNSAFVVSASFVFGSHLAFTMAMDADYIFAMMAAKLISGLCALLLAAAMYQRLYRQSEEPSEVL